MLRFSFTHSKIPKRALWDEKEHKVSFYKHQICDLEGASIKLLPNGIVKKRHWSKKYPICVVIKNRTKIEIQSHPETDTSHDANKDPEKDLQNINFDSIIGLSNDLDIKGGTPKRSNSPPSKHSDDVSGNFSNSPLKSKSRDIPTKAKEHFTKRKKRKISKKEMSTIYDELIDFDSSSIEDDDDTHFLNSDSSSSGDEQKPHISPREKFRLSLENAVSHAIDESENVSLYIFGRTGRQKAELFRRLKIAIDEANAVKSTDMPSFEDTSKNENFDFDSKASELTEDDKSKKEDPESKVKVAFAKGEKGQAGCSDTPSVLWTPKGSLKESILTDAFNAENDIDFWRYMKNIIEAKHQFPQSEKPNDNFLWLNAMIGRIAFDSFKNPVWIAKLQERIQKKLTSLKLPSFMGPLCVSALELGCDAPLVHGATVPVLDSCGLWLDLQVSYSGHATMTLTTQLNLMSLKERKDSHHDDLTQEHTSSGTPVGKKNALAVYYSDLEDTAESSSDDDNTFNTSPQISKATSNEMIQPHVNVGNTPAKKLLRMVDKIAASKYFQHVTEYKYVKRAMEGVSNTDLKLNVELNALLGCFTINIPPPPTDRLWFGFRGSPQLVVRAKPIFGSRVINFAHVTSWIERRLCKELEKILVYPNMEDIIIDSMMEPVID